MAVLPFLILFCPRIILSAFWGRTTDLAKIALFLQIPLQRSRWIDNRGKCEIRGTAMWPRTEGKVESRRERCGVGSAEWKMGRGRGGGGSIRRRVFTEGKDLD